MEPEQFTHSETKHQEIATGRGKETLFRVSFRNQINLIAIADNKANMITSFNAVLISLIIAVFGSGISIKGVPFIDNLQLVIPFTILMICCLASGIFAILAATPKIIKPEKGNEKPKTSLLFFGNFFNKKLEKYLEEMKTLLSSKDEIYEHMIIDMYNNGLVLRRKYRLLSIAYTLFMIGIATCVAAYLVLFMA